MWAALKSPLLLGNDIRKMSPETLSIINNPAIIAISQDPRGKAIQRVTTNTNVSKDEFGVGEAHVWSGPLANGDQVVILFNAANEDLDMSASLADIFVMDGPGGSAPQVEQTWAVHDLWGDRMSQEVAKTVLEQTPGKIEKWYNATETPYAQGLTNEDPRLFGEKIGEVKARSQVQAHVPRHAARVFRLRSVDGKDKARKSLVREEL
jgi:alpha-galactosidase